ncbi:hypothetical protein ACS0TY_030104 [Phlomoides rotata]
MIINKAQGQTLDYVVVYFERTCVFAWLTLCCVIKSKNHKSIKSTYLTINIIRTNW